MLKFLIATVRDDKGTSMVEYGLLVGLIAMIVLIAITALGQNLSSLFSTVATSV